MTRRRWLADRIEGDHASLLGPHADHLARVLRAEIGQQFDIATPAGVRLGRILSVKEGCVDFLLGDFLPNSEIITPDVTLALAIYKFDRMEWAIEKCTELGATRIIPFVASRTEKHLAQAAQKRTERWRRLATQASEQSRRATPPDIADPIKFDKILEQTSPTRIVLAESDAVHPLDLLLIPARVSVRPRVILAIGPEGGWTPSELKKFAAAGWRSATLGPTILRAETAAVAALAIALAHLQ